ncbi:MAG TPA: S41 family peptidase, partial [Gemmatimonadales bacterium]|nr:S41 family peptidase [Gemmatimonadales bacterium]
MKRNRILAGLTALLLPLMAGAFMLQARGMPEGARLFGQVFQRVQEAAVDSVSAAALYEKAARGLVKNLDDPYAELYSPEELGRFQRNNLGNNYGGIGMSIENQDGLITVGNIFPNTPGEAGGVMVGDRILRVDTIPVTGRPLDFVSSQLTGVPGTQVDVTFQRAGVSVPIEVTFTRAVIKVPAVPFTQILDGNIGYIPIQRFNEVAAQHVEEAIQALRGQGAEAFILDLRGNPGGSLEESLKISNLFLQPGQELARVQHRGRTAEVYHANQRSIIGTERLVVLVNGGSASASEIIAGSLQDHDRGLVIGTTTFGKGLVQTLFPLDGGWALKLTTGKWYTPSGRSIQREHAGMNDGRFVEGAPDYDETAPDTSRANRPIFRSDAGRIVYGGGGVTPDLMVAADTLSSMEQEYYRATLAGPKGQLEYATRYQLVLDLKDQVRSPDYQFRDEWRELYWDRLQKAGFEVDREVFDAARDAVTRLIDERLAMVAFGEAARFGRLQAVDNQLQVALDLIRTSRSQQELFALA